MIHTQSHPVFSLRENHHAVEGFMAFTGNDILCSAKPTYPNAISLSGSWSFNQTFLQWPDAEKEMQYLWLRRKNTEPQNKLVWR